MLYTEESPWCDLKCDFSNLQAGDREQKVNSNASKCPHDRKKNLQRHSPSAPVGLLFCCRA